MSEFEVLKELYSHGRTRVLLARHPNYKQRIVVKTTRLEGARLADRRLAIQEAHLLSNLKHPNIIKMLEFREEVDSVTIIMEWAELGDLGACWSIPKNAPELADRVMEILIQLLLALKHLHALNIIHRDVKTRNILAGQLFPGSRSLRVKLADFGIARVVGGGRDGGAMMAKTMIGTPYYSSPEVFCGTQSSACVQLYSLGSPYDFKSDIWSLGCVIYELLAGSRPFHSSKIRDLSEKVTNSDYTPLPKTIPFGLRDLVDSMLQADPKMRPACEELLQHPYVKEHSNRLYEQLQEYARNRAKHYPREFEEIFEKLSNKIGAVEAAKTIICLSAPLMTYTDLELKNPKEVAFKAWKKKNSSSQTSLQTESTIGDETEELTMTIRQVGKSDWSLDEELYSLVHKFRGPFDPQAIQDLFHEINSEIGDEELLETIYNVLKAEFENIANGTSNVEPTLQKLIGPFLHQKFKHSRVYHSLLQLFLAESRLDRWNIG